MANTHGNHLVPLGSGPTTSVYAGRGAAFKVFPAALDRRTRAALEREIAAWRRVPFTRLVHGVEELADGVTAVCCELCGHSLADRVRRDGPLPIAEVLDLGLVLAEALAAAHALGLVHGGVTASNVLIRATGETVLADGGLVARTAFPADPPVDFAAPETIREAVRDARTDLYGLGAVLFLALTGHVPHPARMGELAEQHLLRVLHAPVPDVDRPDVPPGLADLVRALLSPDPDARPTDAAAQLSRVAGSGFDDFADATPPSAFAPLGAYPAVSGPVVSGPVVPGPTVSGPAGSGVTLPGAPGSPFAGPPAGSPGTPDPPSAGPPAGSPGGHAESPGSPSAGLPAGSPGALAGAPGSPAESSPAGSTGVTPGGSSVGWSGAAEPGLPTGGSSGGGSSGGSPGVVLPGSPAGGSGSEPGRPGGVPLPSMTGGPVSGASPPDYFAVPPAPPVRLPLAEVKPGDKKDRSGKLGVAAGIVGALALFAAAPFLLLSEDPPAPPPTPPTVSAPQADAVQIEIVDAVDKVDHVVLTWRSSVDLDYLVIVAPEGQPNSRTVELRDLTMEIPVEPGRRYCFEVHGTDGYRSYASAPKGIREATCVKPPA
ncbi:serine/threonine protein kinase [Saccharothrix hoggarensis]|uniref:non-specific serine/threonine protein kinase n=1 Tax=Saccharothrix hoggarensis TaxID=913853 RepID=A0ABW3R0I2_9PSEU